MLRTMLLISFSVLLAGCLQTIKVEAPDMYLWTINVPKQQMRGYNLKNDYDETGTLWPGAKPNIKPVTSLEDVNKLTCTDPDGLIAFKIFKGDVRTALKHCTCQ